MRVHRIIKNVRRITWCLLLAALLVISTGCVPGFHVSKVSLERPNWVVPPDQYQYKVVVTISFNRAVDQTSVSALGTVIIGLKGMSDGRTVSNIAGTFQVSGDSKTVVFISDQTLGKLINPGAGENVQYSITVVGTDVGAGAVTDSTGEALDGDKDGQPGGDYNETIEVVG